MVSPWNGHPESPISQAGTVSKPLLFRLAAALHVWLRHRQAFQDLPWGSRVRGTLKWVFRRYGEKL
jgi:hypothetical protein